MENDKIHISSFLKKQKIIDVSIYDESFLNKAYDKRMHETRCYTVSDYCNLIKLDRNEAEILLYSLNITYTEFFRNSLTFSLLERVIIPALFQRAKNKKRKEIRIWSAACASGQEAYSIAMLLQEIKTLSGEEINFRIFASDKSEEQIMLAKTGVFTMNAVENLSVKRLNTWFTKKGNFYIVSDHLKKYIDFSVFDLFNEELNCPPVSIFGDFNIVFCSNLLFYYTQADRTKILQKTMNCLSNEGLLITGEAEREILLNFDYEEIYPQSAIFRSQF